MVVDEVIGRVASWVPLMVPAILSVAVGAVSEFISHSDVISGNGSTSGTGAVLSPASAVISSDSAFYLVWMNS